MANTVNKDGNIVEISAMDSDWNYVTTFPGAINGIAVDFIAFSHGQDGDKLSVKNVSATGPRLFPWQGGKVQGPPTIQYYHGSSIKPYIDYSECVLTGSYSIIIKLA